MAKRIWESLAEAVLATTRAQTTHSIWVRGSKMTLEGAMELLGQLLEVSIREIFKVDKTEKRAILGILFLVGCESILEFGHPLLKISGRIVVCKEANRAPLQYGFCRQWPN